MAQFGPPPKREEERRRTNKTTETGESTAVERLVVDPAKLADTTTVPAPAANPAWGPIPNMVYEAAKRSAMRELYEPTDWAQLFIICEALNQGFSPQEVVIQNGPMAGQTVEVVQPIGGAVLTSIMKGLSSLMFTEGDRRRVRLEVERKFSDAVHEEKATTNKGDNVIEIRAQRLGGAS